MSTLYFLVGSTATGKSAVAQYIAEKFNHEILSADSMLIYKGMDIGTAKPTAEEQAKVVYHGVDAADPAERFSVADFRQIALNAIGSVVKTGKDLIVAGGTGLYIKCLTHGLTPSCPPDLETRTKWQILLETDGIDALQRELCKINPKLYESLSDKANPRRLIRALEKAGNGLSGADSTWGNQHNPLLCGLFMPREKLAERITERVEKMYSSGLLEEVRALRDTDLKNAPTAFQGIGYAEALDCLENRCSVEEAKERTAARTRRLAKRQMTWFRNQANVKWIEIENNTSIPELAELVMEQWKNGTGRLPAENVLNLS